MSDTTCPDCAVEMDQIERTTFTGRDMREYQCPKCGRKQIVDCGKALWEILSEANRKDDPRTIEQQLAKTQSLWAASMDRPTIPASSAV